MTELKPNSRDIEEAVKYFKKVNPHMAEDKYYHTPERSQTIRCYLDALMAERKRAAGLVETLKNIEKTIGIAQIRLDGGHSEDCKESGCYGHYESVDPSKLAREALAKYRKAIGEPRFNGQSKNK